MSLLAGLGYLQMPTHSVLGPTEFREPFSNQTIAFFFPRTLKSTQGDLKMLSSLSKNLAEELAAIAAPFLSSGETIASVTPARQRPPFLLRIIPYSELLFYSQYKLFLLVCTSDRVVVLLLKKSIRLTPAVTAIHRYEW